MFIIIVVVVYFLYDNSRNTVENSLNEAFVQSLCRIHPICKMHVLYFLLGSAIFPWCPFKMLYVQTGPACVLQCLRKLLSTFWEKKLRFFHVMHGLCNIFPILSAYVTIHIVNFQPILTIKCHKIVYIYFIKIC